MRGSGMSGHAPFALLGGAVVIVGLAMLVWAALYRAAGALIPRRCFNIRGDSTDAGGENTAKNRRMHFGNQIRGLPCAD